MRTENELTRLLWLWLAPSAPKTLQQRIIDSFFGIGHRPVSRSPNQQEARFLRGRTVNYQLGFASPRNTPAQKTEVSMKRCNACEEEFADKFSFCPVDGSPLNNLAAALVGKEPPNIHIHGEENQQSFPRLQPEFHLTIISSTSLWRRLIAEVSFLIDQLQRAWPEFKSDPAGVGRRELARLMQRLKTLLLQPNVLVGMATAMLVVFSAALSLILFGPAPGQIAVEEEGIGEVVQMISVSVPADMPKPEGSGVGASSNGRVGFNQGKGEGSEAKPKPSRGGGGSGNHDRLPEAVGKIPPPSDIPAPISRPLPHASLPVAGVDLDPALWKNLPFVAYGDPRSKSVTPSQGPGNGGVVGNGDGLGIGSGNGNGVGPGDNGNIGGGKKEPGGGDIGGSNGNHPYEPNRVYRILEVTQRARVISKPEPQYTEAARKNLVTGSVVLSVIFSESGEVTSIRALRTLPDGLTEKAIAAARQIRFVPASRNGQPVSVYMQLEYNFNL